MRVSPEPSREAGFTIVEVMVAALVLVVGIAATLTIFASAQSSSMTSQRNEIAVREAEHQLEEMRGQCYGALTMTTTHPAASPAADDPLKKVVASQFTVKAGLAEDVVSERVDKEDGDNCTDGDGDGKVDAAVAPVSPITIGSGSAAVTGKVYRFVSWRDEECPIADLTKLQSVLTDLQTITNVLASPTGTLTSLAGSSGSLVQLTTDAGKITALLGPLLPALTTPLNAAIAAADPLYARLAPILTRLQTMMAPLQQVLDIVTQSVDLCDLPKTLDLSSFKTLTSALTTIKTAVAALQAPVASLTGVVTPLLSLEPAQLVSGVLGAIGSLGPLTTNLTAAAATLNSTLNSVKGDAATGAKKIRTLAKTARVALQTLAAQPHTTHNTKRLTIAIWLDSNVNAGLRKPFVATSVVSDPRDGLL